MRWRTRHYDCEQQLTLDLTIIHAAPVRTTCASGTPIMIDGVTRPASEWAELRGLKWQTVKMRRMRGDTWRDALDPERPRGLWMQGWMIGSRPGQELRAGC